jgi:crotonobetainyl-CoA:carnitine CoA-transferase CaiB-like acyl-CoA transferase
MEAPLAGIRVIEIASYVAAPAAGALLADLGAEVVKVEVPHGEIMRYSAPRYHGFANREFREAPAFQMDNRGKKSLAIDLRKPEARDAVRRLIADADVVLTNMLPERLERNGFDAKTLREHQPGLIVASVSGYGPLGDAANDPAFDYTAFWARTGLMDQLHEPGAPPAWLRPGVGDHSASLTLVTGILAALRTRDRTGEGQVIDVSLQHVGLYIQGNDTAMTLATGESPPRHDRRAPRNPLWNHYPTADGRWLFLVMIESDRYWPILCEALERPDWLQDERFIDAIARFRNSPALVSELEAVFAAHSLDEWRTKLGRHRLIWAPVQTLAEAVADPAARASGSFQMAKHPEAGEFETVSPPLRMSGHELRSDRCAPLLGADNEALLREAGLDDAQIRMMLGSE